MSLSSSLTDFSLAELFQIIDQGRKSGRLTVCRLLNGNAGKAKSQYYFIWFRQGRIVAVSNSLDGQGLITKISERNWVRSQFLEKILLMPRKETPLGLNLKTAGILNAEQLNLLFASQIQQIRELFEIQKGVFKLDSKAPIPSQEMTGLSLRAIEVALMALRNLKDWKTLAEALPEPDSAIYSITQTKPEIRLHTLEWQVWEFADGTISLDAIANQLNQPIAIVQQAAFRLKIAGLIEEVSFVKSTPEISKFPLDCRLINSPGSGNKKSTEPEMLKIVTSFLDNLVGYLRSNI
ncbi:MAG: DUF4388 domain-containing protein [Pelatocladus maniniholoensis HA4357-MV3]|jgi:hypothetical protein|uniref:DUF4388 domain-containing protein n=1 Tax=Pelatocladus maniniholoensis HA4357-MV3 TaxID=1117104 RepID=A0A9E3LWP2_9NOST|nr:DUF4388 domain-containing protein [Pelatocladus maniniholoensis HA4357-MV3]BAZ68003.1 hypothetical protein NIES4106_27610 [Fischerella sp. NIES-4106]